MFKQDFNLQSIPEFKQAYTLCADCKIIDKLSPHIDFIDYLDKRARSKIGSPDLDYKPSFYFPALRSVIEEYIPDLEAGKALEYETKSGKIVKIIVGKEFRELKRRVGDKSINYLTWTLAKLREILILKGSAIKISRQ
jgi:hypothetical protein